MHRFPLEPDRATMTEMGRLVLDRVIDRTDKLPTRPATSSLSPRAEAELAESFLAPPPARGGDLTALLARLDEAADCALETAGPGHLAYIPGSGLYTAALAEFYNRAVNRYGGLASVAPALAALEESVIRWMAREVCGLPEGSGGLLTSGGSMATFSATVAARHHRLGEDLAGGTVYTTAFAHHSVAKAARLAGIRATHIRTVPHTPDLRMDPQAAAAMIRADRDAGLRPFLLVATAGTTDTGTIDPLPQLAGLSRREDVWFHIDAAYGGFFRLTARGSERLTGMEEADSVTLDPHKTLFMPFGTGALVVRDLAALHAAHDGTGRYLQDMASSASVPDSGRLGPELTHEIRGLRAWLPLHLHGVDAFREALDEKLDLAEHVHDTLSGVAELEVLQRPDLSTVIFRVRPANDSQAAAERADEASRRLLERINGHQRIVLSSTVVDDRYTLRVCVVSHRTHHDRITEALKIITAEAKRHTTT
ncbi:pyridoxal phosphate-dependent decarboxylase family protein [Streptomyces liliifuscus]|uniref:Aminotransferase class V-fold PLP-dependent enzyme n=1 Tax=Streptomyces liliifuscus TaxID=2797636 RepID=A0A7T7RGZ1_9ACTN|nr:aminotransferase class V-fold PLP-dependent enzyme [Streptomyces liliifuscus]QQM46348.1 aminotransferase class V-fold PLP-dependent enzyme [Streptomyces liliifuscus]